MIGNDVVDLALTRRESNWKRTGFLEKIFTRHEQLLIKNTDNPELLIWNLWSRKEAAYKIYNRVTGIRAFNPLCLECFYINEHEGMVLCKGNVYFTKTVIKNTFIHSIAVTDVADFALVENVERKQTIVKKDGIPFTYCQQKRALQPVSISHHGRYSKIITLKK